MRNPSKISKANRIFTSGDYKSAISEYKSWAASFPEIKNSISANIKLAELRKKREEAPRPKKFTPKITVIVPCHNVEKYIEKCIQSIKNQTTKEIQIILVDDGSTDGTLKILEKHKESDERITLITNSKKSGNSGTPRNQALHYAKGEYIAFIDADDWIEPCMLNELYEKAKLTDSDITTSTGFFRELDNGETEHVKMSNYEFIPEKNQKRIDLLSSQHLTIVWFRIYRREFIENNGIRFAKTKTSADAPFSFKCLIRTNKVTSVEKSYYHYRFGRPGSTIERRKGPDAFELIDSYRKLISDLTEAEYKEYGNLIISKLLGDYDYNRNLIKEDLKKPFETAVLSFAAQHIPHPKSKESLSKYKIKLIEKGEEILKNNLQKKETSNLVDISIIIPAHNVSSYLNKCLESINLPPEITSEIIIINDGSNDNTFSVMQELALKKEKNIILINSNKKSGNPGTPRNVGIESATGKYISFIDADDQIVSSELAKLISESKKNPSDIISSTHFTRKSQDSTQKIKINQDTKKTENTLSGAFFSNIWSRIYKSSLLEINSIRFPGMYIAEDMCFSVKTHLKSKSTVYVESCFYIYTYNRPKSTTSERTGIKGFRILNDIPKIIEYLDLHNQSVTTKKKIQERILNSITYTYNRIEEKLKHSFSSEFRHSAQKNNILTEINPETVPPQLRP